MIADSGAVARLLAAFHRRRTRSFQVAQVYGLNKQWRSREFVTGRSTIPSLCLLSLPFPFPSLPLKGAPLNIARGSGGVLSTVRYPSRVWGRATAEIEFGAFNLALKCEIWWHQFYYLSVCIFQKSGTKKLCIFLTGGAYAPYAPCMRTPLLTTVPLLS